MPHRSTPADTPAKSRTVPTYALRGDRQQVVDRVWELWSSSVAQKILLQMPMGAGKMEAIATIARRFTERGAPVLFLVHREELLHQAKAKLEGILGHCVGLIRAGVFEDRNAPIQVASIASLLTRQLPPASLAIVDEAHHFTALTYTQLFAQFPDAAILGVTATPIRTDGRGFEDIYERLVAGPSISWLIDRGYLSACRLFAAPQTVDTTGVGQMGDDYNPRQLLRAVEASLTMSDAIASWRHYADSKKTVIFAVNIEHSKAIAAAYRARGIAAEHLDGDVEETERQAILNRFRAGQTLVLSSCALLSEGFEIPDIEAVQCIRPTQSLALWLQTIGHGLRLRANRQVAIVIDHTDNWKTHGLPDRPLAWSLKVRQEETPHRAVMCPHCRATFHLDSIAQTPGSFEWCPQRREFQSIAHYTCPHCDRVLEMDRGSEAGEPPQLREIDPDRDAETWEIPADCNVEILNDLYRLVGWQRRVKRHVTLQWLLDRLAHIHPDLGIPELRECALLAGMDADWAIDWAHQTAAKRWPERDSRSSETMTAGRPEAVARYQPQTDERPGPGSPDRAIVAVTPQDIVRAIAARRQESPPEAIPSKNSHRTDDSDDVIHLEMTDRLPSVVAAPSTPQLPPLSPTTRAVTTAARNTSAGVHPSVGVNVGADVWERQLRGKLGLWHVKIAVTPDRDGSWQTRIDYRAPGGRSFCEQLAGYFPQRYREGIAELERCWRPSRRRPTRSLSRRDRRKAARRRAVL